eukprot:SAG31_NODE_2459_length_5660_cov_13.094947_3_plen_275_part_00
MADAASDIDKGRRCIPCIGSGIFMDCPLKGPTQLAPGWAELNIDVPNGTRHFYECPFGKKACSPVTSLALTLFNTNFSSCMPGYTGLLCGACEAGYSQAASGCVSCKRSDSFFLAMFGAILLCVLCIWSWTSVRCNGAKTAGVILWLGVLQRLWPRLSQSLSIFIANFQIISCIPFVTGVKFPSPIGQYIDAIGGFVNGAIDAIPAVACAVGGSFIRRLLLKCLTPVAITVVALIVHFIRVWHLNHFRMPILDDQSVDPRKTWRAKIARALVRV